MQTLNSKNFSAISIKGSGSLFTVIDTNTCDLVFSIVSKKVTVGQNYQLNTNCININDNACVLIDNESFIKTNNIFNTAVGINSHSNVTTATQSTAVGYNSSMNLTSGNGNVSTGYFSLRDNTTGSSNTAIGTQSLRDNISGDENVALGQGSIGNNNIGDRNTAIGTFSLVRGESDGNSCLGYSSLGSTITGEYNIAIGFRAGLNMSSSQNRCITIGNDGASIAQDGEIHLGNATEHIRTYIHAPLITNRKTASSGPAAIPLTANIHEITTTGADALTLADGVDGQHICIIMVADGGNGILTPDTFASGTTITFSDVGNTAQLLYSSNGGWYYIGGTAGVA